MASTCIRSMNRTCLSSLRSCISKPKGATLPPSFPPGSRTASPSPARRFASFSRTPVELGCFGGSFFPLHSAVAAARLTSCLSSTSRSGRALSQGTLCCTYPGL